MYDNFVRNHCTNSLCELFGTNMPTSTRPMDNCGTTSLSILPFTNFIILAPLEPFIVPGFMTLFHMYVDASINPLMLVLRPHAFENSSLLK